MSNDYIIKRVHIVKEENPCQVCGEDERVCLDLHHIDPNEKLFELSNINKKSLAQVELEIVKCASLCSNCHRKLHAGLIDPYLEPVKVPKDLFTNKYDLDDYYTSYAPKEYVERKRQFLIKNYPELLEEIDLSIK